MELETERNDQINAELEKYAISSLDEAVSLCDENGINVESIAKTIKEDVSELTIMAYCLGVAIAVKKDTKLASYVAMDIGEGLQAFCMPGTEAAENRAGLGHGYQASMYIKNNNEKDENDTDYGAILDFFGLSNDELIKITTLLANRVEEIMNK